MLAAPASVLVIDDDDSLRTLVGLWLRKAQMNVIEANDGAKGLALAKEHADALDCIVLDVMMPGMDGFEVLAKLQADEATARIPVVLLTAHANTENDMVRAAESGAVEHLAKPFSGAVLSARIRLLTERTKKDRVLRVKLRSAEENAAVDPLTGLFNRRHLERRMIEITAQAQRHKHATSFLLVDLDHFKSVNDTFGHDGGDRVLVHAATTIRSMLRTEDLAFRYGGEEFLLVLQVCDRDHAHMVATRLRGELLANAIELNGTSYQVKFSGGIATANTANNFEFSRIIDRADTALYEAKRAGRDRVHFEAGVPPRHSEAPGGKF
jgi:two-component system, cell cycle response regulator